MLRKLAPSLYHNFTGALVLKERAGICSSSNSLLKAYAPLPSLLSLCARIACRNNSTSASASSLTIDPSTTARLKQLQAMTPETKVGLRIEVEGGGCSGFQYKFKLDSAVQPDDIVIEQDGCQIICDTVSLDFLKGSKIEFEESLMRSAFVVSVNPNSETTCGCGSSFALKMK